MELLEELKSLGVNVDEGLARMMGKKDLYTRLLGVYVKTMGEQYVGPDFDANDSTVVERAHSIKGTSGNMSITPVYEAYTKIVERLRAGKPEEARALLKAILPVQEKIIACIKRYR